MSKNVNPKEVLGLEELTPMQSAAIQGGADKKKEKQKDVDVEIDVEVDLP